MKSETMIEIALGVVLTGFLGWLATQVFRLSGDNQAIRADLVSTLKRLDRIAEVIPDARVKIAKDETARHIDLAVIQSDPVQRSGEWKVYVYVIDRKNVIRTCTVPAADGRDRRTETFLRGVAYSNPDITPVSLRDMRSYSNDAGVGFPALTHLNIDNSFLLRFSGHGYEEESDKIAAKTTLSYTEAVSKQKDFSCGDVEQPGSPKSEELELGNSSQSAPSPA